MARHGSWHALFRTARQDLMMNERRKLTPRNTPIQKRALERRDKILEVTAVLLEEIGQDDLTTILVAKRAEVSLAPCAPHPA